MQKENVIPLKGGVIIVREKKENMIEIEVVPNYLDGWDLVADGRIWIRKR